MDLERVRLKLGPSNGSSIRVMVVDDNRELCSETASFLQEQAPYYSCDTAFSVEEGKSYLSSQWYDLLSADWIFDGLASGWFMFGPARQRNPDMGIIVLSEHPRVKEKALETGASAFLFRDEGWRNGTLIKTADNVTARSLKRKLTNFARTSPWQAAFMHATSSHACLDPDVPEKELTDVVKCMLKLQHFDEQLSFCVRLRASILTEWMMEPQCAFVLCYVRDFGPVPLPKLQEEINLARFSVSELARLFVAAGLIEASDRGLRITAEGTECLRAFDLEWD